SCRIPVAVRRTLISIRDAHDPAKSGRALVSTVNALPGVGGTSSAQTWAAQNKTTSDAIGEGFITSILNRSPVACAALQACVGTLSFGHPFLGHLSPFGQSSIRFQVEVELRPFGRDLRGQLGLQMIARGEAFRTLIEDFPRIGVAVLLPRLLRPADYHPVRPGVGTPLFLDRSFPDGPPPGRSYYAND